MRSYLKSLEMHSSSGMNVWLVAGMLLLFVSACAAPRAVVEEPEEIEFSLAEFEDFDISRYRDVPIPDGIEIEHDVPGELMAGDLGRRLEPVERRPAQGYRIQLNMTENRQEAERWRNDALTWWESMREDPDLQSNLLPPELPIYILYEAPYFRIRIGDFTARQSAQRALDEVRREFPRAWIVPDRIN